MFAILSGECLPGQRKRFRRPVLGAQEAIQIEVLHNRRPELRAFAHAHRVMFRYVQLVVGVADRAEQRLQIPVCALLRILPRNHRHEGVRNLRIDAILAAEIEGELRQTECQLGHVARIHDKPAGVADQLLNIEHRVLRAALCGVLLLGAGGGECGEGQAECVRQLFDEFHVCRLPVLRILGDRHVHVGHGGAFQIVESCDGEHRQRCVRHTRVRGIDDEMIGILRAHAGGETMRLHRHGQRAAVCAHLLIRRNERLLGDRPHERMIGNGHVEHGLVVIGVLRGWFHVERRHATTCAPQAFDVHVGNGEPISEWLGLRENTAVLGDDLLASHGHVAGGIALPRTAVGIAAQQACTLPADQRTAVQILFE